jgi:hypothetical protein
VCVDQTDASVVKRRASIMSRGSLSRATGACGKRSSRASVFERFFNARSGTPRASSAMMNGDDNLTLVNMPAHFFAAHQACGFPYLRLRE